jgi:hypothetical protein
VTPYSSASTPTRCSCSAVRSGSADEDGSTFEQARNVDVPSAVITSSFVRTRCSTASNRSGATPCTSRTGWNRSIVSPRSAHRDLTSRGDSGEDTRSLSNSSIPSKPAAATAVSLSASSPLSETVAIPLRISPSSPT